MSSTSLLRSMIKAVPPVHKSAVWLRDTSRSAWYRTLGLGYVEKTIKAGPNEGLRFSAGKRVKYSKNFWDGSYEIEMCRFMYEAVSHDSICYDVGANLGYHALIMARKAKDGRVFAFEPLAEASIQLEQNVSINGVKNVELVKKAIADKTGTILLGRDISIDQAAIRWSSDDDHLHESVRCESVTIDDFVQAGNPAPTFIKIDVEGAEVDVLRGAIETMIRYQSAIMCETHGAKNAVSVYDILHERDYRIFSVGGRVVPVDSVNTMPTNMYDGHVYACSAGCGEPPQEFL